MGRVMIRRLVIEIDFPFGSLKGRGKGFPRRLWCGGMDLGAQDERPPKAMNVPWINHKPGWWHIVLVPRIAKFN